MVNYVLPVEFFSDLDVGVFQGGLIGVIQFLGDVLGLFVEVFKTGVKCACLLIQVLMRVIKGDE